MKLFRSLIVLLLSVVAMVPALAQDNMQILRDKVQADKKLVVALNMELNDAEGKGFWPVYDAYQHDLEKVNQRMVGLIQTYADAYNKGPIPDETAKKLLADFLSIEESEVKLKRDYVPKLEKVLPESKVARYMQIESKIRAVVRYELASEVPLVE